jgi:membrane glycosyltransferase
VFLTLNGERPQVFCIGILINFKLCAVAALHLLEDVVFLENVTSFSVAKMPLGFG